MYTFLSSISIDKVQLSLFFVVIILRENQLQRKNNWQIIYHYAYAVFPHISSCGANYSFLKL